MQDGNDISGTRLLQWSMTGSLLQILCILKVHLLYVASFLETHHSLKSLRVSEFQCKF